MQFHYTEGSKVGGGDTSYYVPSPKSGGGVMSSLSPPWVAPMFCR